MSEPADEVLEAGIRDAKTALAMIQGFGGQWEVFAKACRTQQLDIAGKHGERLVAMIEVAVDLFLSSHKRIAQFDQLTQGPES